MKIKFTIACVALAGLAACDTATPPTAGQPEYNALLSLHSATNNNPEADVRTYTATTTYNGTAVSEATFGTDNDFRVVADMSMTVDFADNNGQNISGSISEINLIDRDGLNRDQLAEGQLSISGSEIDGDINASATGNMVVILGQDGSGIKETTAVDLTLSADVRSRTDFADTVRGEFGGDGIAPNLNGVDASFRAGRFVLDDPTR